MSGLTPFRALREDSGTGSERGVFVPVGGEQGVDPGAFGAHSFGDPLAEPAVGPELAFEPGLHAPGEAGPGLGALSEVAQQRVSAEQTDLPALVLPAVSRFEHPEQGGDGVGVGVEQALGDKDPVCTAVPLDLAPVGAELCVYGEPRLQGPGRQRLDRLEHRLALPVEAGPQMKARVRVADEEPAVGGP